MPNKITRETTLPELAAIVYGHLAKHGISATLTGGAVVTIYTSNRYESGDLDFISPNDHKHILEVMKLIGFEPHPPASKNLSHSESEFTVEFPGRVNMIGGSLEVVDHQVEIDGVKIRMLSPTQSVMDRLAAYIAWKDPQGLDQAEWICERHPVLFEKIKKWAEAEGATQDQMKNLIERCQKGMKKYNSNYTPK